MFRGIADWIERIPTRILAGVMMLAWLLYQVEFIREGKYYRESTLHRYLNLPWPAWFPLVGGLLAAVCVFFMSFTYPGERYTFVLMGAVAGWFEWDYYTVKYYTTNYESFARRVRELFHYPNTLKLALFLWFLLAAGSLITLSARLGAGAAPIATPAGGSGGWTDDQMVRTAMPIALGIGLAGMILLPNTAPGGTGYYQWGEISFWDALRGHGGIRDRFGDEQTFALIDSWAPIVALILVALAVVLVLRLPARFALLARGVLILGGLAGLIYPIDIVSKHWLGVGDLGMGTKLFALTCLGAIGVGMVTILDPKSP